MNTYRLNSTSLVYTPSIVALAKAHFPFQREWAVRLLVEGYGLSAEIVTGLLSGSVTYSIENESVVFTA
jgi:hypothetical protein